jgi:hypothetical protein
MRSVVTSRTPGEKSAGVWHGDQQKELIERFDRLLGRDCVEFGFERFDQVVQLGPFLRTQFRKFDAKGVPSHPSHLGFFDSERPIKTGGKNATLKRRTDDDRHIGFDPAPTDR